MSAEVLLQQDISEFKTDVLIRITKIEAKIEVLENSDAGLEKDFEELKAVVNDNLQKLDEKCTYIEREMPSASTYKFIMSVVAIVITTAVGMIAYGLK